MAVQKFRTFEEARRALWLPAGPPAPDERCVHHLRFGGATAIVVRRGANIERR